MVVRLGEQAMKLALKLEVAGNGDENFQRQRRPAHKAVEPAERMLGTADLDRAVATYRAYEVNEVTIGHRRMSLVR